MDSTIITACTLYVSQHIFHSDNVVAYHLWKSWTYDPNAIPFPNWGLGLTHVTIDHYLSAVTIGLMLVCLAFAFVYGKMEHTNT